MAMTEDEFVRKARRLYRNASDREKRRIENDKWYFHDWIQRLIGWIQVIVGFVQSLCFLSTAVCRRSGLPDDCDSLETLREFRDSYLLGGGQHSKAADVEEYYRIAPGIYLWIEAQDEADQIWGRLEETVQAAIALVKAGQVEEAFFLYRRSVLGIVPCFRDCYLE